MQSFNPSTLLENAQEDLFGRLPGAAGGRALSRLRGKSYFRQLGQRGGQQTVKRHGKAYMRQIATVGGAANRRRLYTTPRTISPWYGGRERRIPYWPPKHTKRRKRPILIRIEIEGGAL
jgi:hypothetical protein